MKIITIISILALVVGSVGCGDNPPVVYPTSVPMQFEEPPLGSGDKIAIVIYNGASEKSKAEYILDNNGEIDIPYLGGVKAIGKMAQDLKKEIQSRLADGYLVDPIVSLSVLEINSRRISVSGQVQKTGTIKFTPGMTIVEAVALSGGLTPMARANALRVTRISNNQSETWIIPYEMINEGKRPNFPLLPGDQIYVDTRVF